MQIKLIFRRKGFGFSSILKVKALGTHKWPVWNWFLSWFIPSWLVNISVGDTYCSGQRFESHTNLNFFQAFFLQLRKCI